MSWASRLLRELPRDPQALLERQRTYANSTFLDLFFPWLDQKLYQDPSAALGYAKLLPDLALAAEPDQGETPDGRQEHRGRLVKAWSLLGSAHRATGSHDESNTAFEAASAIVASEAIDTPIRIDFERRLAYLRTCQGRYEEALSLAHSVVESSRQSGNGKTLARALACLGYAYAESERFTEALSSFSEALVAMGKPNEKLASDARLHTGICGNLAHAICDSRNPNLYVARQRIEQAEEFVKGGRRSLARYRLRWIKGLIWARAGHPKRAAQQIRIALEGFEHHKLPYDSALCALDLGEILRELREWEELEKLARHSYTVFADLSANTKAIQAMSQWRDAVLAQSLTVQLTATARKSLQARIGPGGCCKTRIRSAAHQRVSVVETNNVSNRRTRC